MIKIKPATRPHGRYVCNCCFSDNDTKEIHLSADGTMGMTIILCKNCRDELIDVIHADDTKPYEKFESAKDHIYKLAGDYKCWDNRLTKDEAVELCHILEQEPCDKCEVGNPCLYCKHEFEPQESEET